MLQVLRFGIFGTGVENTLSLTYPYKKKWGDGMISGERGGQGVGLSLPINLSGKVA
jgi:hypothetical protein